MVFTHYEPIALRGGTETVRLEPPLERQPILDASTCRDVRVIVCEIARALHPPADVGRPDNTPSAGRSASLAGGYAGQALFYSYLSKAYPDSGHDAAVMALVDAATDLVALSSPGWGLFSGVPGVGWAVAHLYKGAPGDAADDPNAEVDRGLARGLDTSPGLSVWPGDYDLVSGVTGLGVYALERLPAPAATTCLERIIELLDQAAERGPEGITWRTPPLVHASQVRALANSGRPVPPVGPYNLGMAHGTPGVIALLGLMCAAKVAEAKAYQLLDGAVDWLLAQQLPHGAASRFPNWVGPGLDSAPSLLRWCYGDLGIAAALSLAARCVGRDDWHNVATVVALEAAARPAEQAGIADAALCHGACGLAHIFGRLYHATGQAAFRDQARRWLRWALDFRRTDEGIAGFPAWKKNEAGQWCWMDDTGMIDGAAGVGLALLAATTSIEPAWDRVLLLS